MSANNPASYASYNKSSVSDCNNHNAIAVGQIFSAKSNRTTQKFSFPHPTISQAPATNVAADPSITVSDPKLVHGF